MSSSTSNEHEISVVAGVFTFHYKLSLCLCQIAAMQAGLLKVVPQAVLDLLTWQEVEKKVCGDPEITVEALKRLGECVAQRSRDLSDNNPSRLLFVQ